MSHMTTREIYIPASKFILGLPTTIVRWEIVGKRVYVEFTDGFSMHSEETPGSLRAMAKAGKVILSSVRAS